MAQYEAVGLDEATPRLRAPTTADTLKVRGAAVIDGATTCAALDSNTHTISSDLVLATGSITSASGAISFGNENLVTTGTFGAGACTLGSTTVTTLRSAGKIYAGNSTLTTVDQFYMGAFDADSPRIYFDSDDYLQYDRALEIFSFVIGGATQFGFNATTANFSNNDLTMSGTIASGTHTISTDLVLATGSITSASGAITFGNENLTTTGSVKASAGTRTATGTTDTLLATDNGGVVVYTNGSAIAVTLPSDLAVNWHCTIIQTGAGVPTVSPDPADSPLGSTINGAYAGVAPSARWKGLYLNQFAANQYVALV